LDAPNRLGRFLDGRMIRMMTAPARASGKTGLKLMNLSFDLFSRVFSRVLGGDLIRDLSAFVAALESMFGGFRERAQQTYELLKAPGTAFIVVSAPEPDALREASYFVERLGSDQMPLAGLVLNRVHRTVAPSSGEPLTAGHAEAAAEHLSGREQDAATRQAVMALLVHSDIARTAAQDARMARRFRAAHPEVAVTEIPALSEDVHDLDGLRKIGALLSDRGEGGKESA
jgi:anion-transporting  ArsA/GET3 family ATPase